jgi:hypothetical protein
MRPAWPDKTVFRRLVLDVEQDHCEQCRGSLHVCDHRFHRFYTLEQPLELVCRLAHCSNRDCPARSQTLSPQAEQSLVLPRCLFGWDVFCWIGHRRFKRHWSIPQIQTELQETYHIPLSTDTLRTSLQRYQNVVAARQQDPQQLAHAYRGIKSLVLTIDGLQPEKGHETLYVVRELNAKRVWFGEALLSSTADEVHRLLVRAHQWAEALSIPVRLWISDKQDAFVKGIAKEFPKVPHRYCANHFLRDLAKPTLEIDSHAKVQLRKHVRGLREIEREVLNQCQKAQKEAVSSRESVLDLPPQGSGVGIADSGKRKISDSVLPKSRISTSDPLPEIGILPQTTKAVPDKDGQIVLDYCAAVRGILNDDQGGPLSPPGLRMAAGLKDVQASLQRNLALNKGGQAHGQMERLAARIESGLAQVKEDQREVRKQVKEIKRVAATLVETSGSNKMRRVVYEKLQGEYEGKAGAFYGHISRLMLSFVAGLFVWPAGTKRGKEWTDNLDLERWFRKPKGHERRIHGRRHAGVRIVQEGSTLVLTLDAHENRSEPFTVAELLPYRLAEMPPEQVQAIERRKVMRQARSKKNEKSSAQS